MDDERKVLVTDLGVGVLAIVAGSLSLAPDAVDFWWAGAVIAVATAGFVWAEEHGAIGGSTTVGLVVAFGVAFFAIGSVYGVDAIGEIALPVALVGLGVGVLAYRLYFGLVRPVPESRMRKMGGRMV